MQKFGQILNYDFLRTQNVYFKKPTIEVVKGLVADNNSKFPRYKNAKITYYTDKTKLGKLGFCSSLTIFHKNGVNEVVFFDDFGHKTIWADNSGNSLTNFRKLLKYCYSKMLK